jgi:hypothetical protein
MSDMSYGSSLTKSAMAAAIGYAGARFILGESPYDGGNVLGYSLSAPMAAGLSCGLGTLATDLAGNKILSMAPQTVVGALTVTGSEAAIAGAATAGVIWGSGGSASMGFILGAGSNLAAEAIAGKVCTAGRCDPW